MHPKPWQMTTLAGVGDASDHSCSRATTAGSISATAEPPAVSNASNAIAKQRTPPSPRVSPA